MIDQTTNTVSVDHHYDLPAERVFDAWLDPQTASKFLFTTAVGEYLVIERPRRLVFAFAVPKYSPDYTTVTIDIVENGRGCRLTLTHEGVLPEYADKTREGWATILSNLPAMN